MELIPSHEGFGTSIIYQFLPQFTRTRCDPPHFMKMVVLVTPILPAATTVSSGRVCILSRPDPVILLPAPGSTAAGPCIRTGR